MDPRLKRLQEEIASRITELSAAQLTHHPPGKWCATEILEHLHLTYTGTIKGFARVAEAGKPLVTIATWKQRFGALLVVAFGYMPPGREAPRMARPRGIPADEVRAEITRKIAEMDESIRQCEEKFGRTKKLLDHLILGPLTGNEWRKFHLVHGLHHLKQIERLAAESMTQNSKH